MSAFEIEYDDISICMFDGLEDDKNDAFTNVIFCKTQLLILY